MEPFSITLLDKSCQRTNFFLSWAPNQYHQLWSGPLSQKWFHSSIKISNKNKLLKFHHIILLEAPEGIEQY